MLLLSLLFAPLVSLGQTDTSKFIPHDVDLMDVTFSGVGKWGTNYHGITFWHKDSTITIEGDTMQAIRLLFLNHQQYVERYWSARAVLEAINLKYLKILLKSKTLNYTVDNYWKTEKKYKGQF